MGGGNAGAGGGSGSALGGATGTGGDACAEVTSAANQVARGPVDIILVIDNSGSMSEEIESVEKNINTNFASILDSSGLDYRIILLSEHGPAQGSESICISPPLSGNATCNPPPDTPTNGPKFFHYSNEIGSTNSLSEIIDTYNAPGDDGTGPMGWSPWLRPNAFKTFIEITDDDENMDVAEFDRQLTNLQPANFGTTVNRNYVFHSIVGLAAKASPAEAYQPNEPLITAECPTADSDGTTYQALSKLTGGLRFPVCDPNLYGTVFRAVAQGVISTSTVACQFQIPTPPVGSTVSNRIYVVYTPGNGSAMSEFSQVAKAADCSIGKFYVEGTQVKFCPQTCASVRMDPNARVAVRFTCEPLLN